MKKRGVDKDIVILLISTLITVTSWIGFEVYRAYVKVNTTAEVEKSLQQVNPVLNRELFGKLRDLQK